MVADELAETQRRMRRLEEDIAALAGRPRGRRRPRQGGLEAVVDAFNSAAERIEGITKKLNHDASVTAWRSDEVACAPPDSALHCASGAAGCVRR